MSRQLKKSKRSSDISKQDYQVGTPFELIVMAKDDGRIRQC
jgi:hypothetical protein